MECFTLILSPAEVEFKLALLEISGQKQSWISQNSQSLLHVNIYKLSRIPV